jgi:heme-degrading monooxygenase HmoA
MLVHFTNIKVSPDKVQEATEILAGSKLLDYFLKAKGLHHGSLSESVDEPGRLLSLSMWDKPEDAQAVFANPNYAALVGELRNLLLAAPSRMGFNNLRVQVVRDLPIDKPLYLHNTIVTVAPENTGKLISVLYSEKVLSLLSTIPGFIMSYALDSLEEPGRVVSMSWWDTAIDAKTTFSMPVYAELLGDMRPYFIKIPERQGYNLLRLVRHDRI